ncbi:MAG: DUF559 domain-containing protein [Acidobacteriota bacterium]
MAMTTQSTENSRRLRQHDTDAEHRLWEVLRDRRLGGKKFRRQHAVGRFVLDFYCPAEKVAVELDGAGHQAVDQIQYDEERTKLLHARSIRVLRFANEEVLLEPERVSDTILQTLRGYRR